MPFSLFHDPSRDSVDPKRKETTLIDRAQLVERCQQGAGCSSIYIRGREPPNLVVIWIRRDDRNT